MLNNNLRPAENFLECGKVRGFLTFLACIVCCSACSDPDMNYGTFIEGDIDPETGRLYPYVEPVENMEEDAELVDLNPSSGIEDLNEFNDYYYKYVILE